MTCTRQRDSSAEFNSNDGFSGRRANEQDHALFDMRQERILLRLVEAMHLVDEQHAADALREIDFGFGERLAHVGQSESTAEIARKRAFAYFASSRPASSCRNQAVPRGSSNRRGRPRSRAQAAPGTEQTLLADDFVERGRTHAFGERLQVRRLGNSRRLPRFCVVPLT
jgi:hypothetical protein